MVNLTLLKLAQEVTDEILGKGAYVLANGFDPSKGETMKTLDAVGTTGKATVETAVEHKPVPWQSMIDKDKARAKILDEHSARSKQNLQYGILRVSARKCAVIRYTGAGQHNAGNDKAFDLHRFELQAGFEKVSYAEAVEELRRLSPEHDWI